MVRIELASMKRAAATLAVVAVCIGLYHLLNPLRVQHTLATGIWLVLLAIPLTRKLGTTLTPMVLFVYIYDLLRLFGPRAREVVSLTEVPDAERYVMEALFGPGTPLINEWLGQFAWPAVDLVGALLYANHVTLVVVAGIYLYIWRRHERLRLHGFFWGYVLMSTIGFATQALFPVAPPWYLDIYGATVPEGELVGDAARLARFDAYWGIEYFRNFYARSAYVFGAMPSLHVAFPAWAALCLTGTRWHLPMSIAAALMAFYAVYFNHHFAVDVVAGLALTVVVYWAFFRSRVASWVLVLQDAIERQLGASTPASSEEEPRDGNTTSQQGASSWA